MGRRTGVQTVSNTTVPFIHPKGRNSHSSSANPSYHTQSFNQVVKAHVYADLPPSEDELQIAKAICYVHDKVCSYAFLTYSYHLAYPNPSVRTHASYTHLSKLKLVLTVSSTWL